MQNRKCNFCDECEKTTFNRKNQFYLCGKHKQQLFKYGKILDRTKFTKNQIIKYDDYAEIVLVDIDWNEIARTQISLDKVDIVSKHKWRLRPDSYVSTRINKKAILLHRFVSGAIRADQIVDHIDGNKLNNKSSNLRFVTTSQNQINKKTMANNTSGVTGVTWDKARNKWKASLNYENKCINLGRFDSFEEAVEVRKDAEIKYHKEYRPKK